MTDYLSGWNVGVDPEQTDVLPDGSTLQEVTLVLVDTEDHYKNDEPQLRAPVAVTLTPAEARTVAARLIAASTEAEHQPPSSNP
ncbi:MAG: hypothetical protein ABR992_18150 [Solirubrobacteraceae bacterium]|jgi:hypothetical protein